jgi:hypothetical protein
MAITLVILWLGMTAAFSAGWCMRARLMPLDQ